ncbi:hypothetical protein RMATCC62417_04558 [Rhizopus microsporus]|nr:hypothetical protein RMATCC62417_04558 [Rhizopus microsporus]
MDVGMWLTRIVALNPWTTSLIRMNLWLRRLSTHSKYLKHAACGESSRICSILVEKSKEEDIRMKEANIKRDYIHYIVQVKARLFDLKIEKCTSASAAAKQLDIHAQASQRWVNDIMRVLIAFLRIVKK